MAHRRRQRAGTDRDWRAFSSQKVIALTGLTKRQLQYWDQERFLSPSMGRGGRGGRRLYAFRDLVSLRVAADLRHSGISLQMIRKVVRHLEGLDYENPLAEIRFWVAGDRLYFEEAGTVREGRRPDQTIAEFVVPFAAIVQKLESAIASLESVRAFGTVERRRGVLGSKEVVAGTRIPVASIRRLAADGADEAEIIELYPDLTPADVRVALSEGWQQRRVGAG